MTQDFSKMMEAAKQIQGKMQQAQQDIASFTATAGSESHCQVTVDGKHQVRKIKFNEDFLKEPKEFVEEMLVNTFNQAMSRVEEEMKNQMMNMTKDLGIDMDALKRETGGDDGSGAQS